MNKKSLLVTKNLILSLLKAELKTSKLIKDLYSIGLHPDDLYLGISTELLKLIGFQDPENDDELHDYYFHQLDSRCELKLSEFLENLNLLTEELYEELLAERKRREDVK